MKYYIKQKAFSLRGKTKIYNENEEIEFVCESEVALAKRAHIYDNNNQEVAYISQKTWSLKPIYYIERKGVMVAEVVKEMTLTRPKYTINGLNWSISGKFSEHEYLVLNGQDLVATISKKWLTWGDTYEIDVVNPEDAVNVIALVIIINHVMACEANC